MKKHALFRLTGSVQSYILSENSSPLQSELDCYLMCKRSFGTRKPNPLALALCVFLGSFFIRFNGQKGRQCSS